MLVVAIERLDRGGSDSQGLTCSFNDGHLNLAEEPTLDLINKLAGERGFRGGNMGTRKGICLIVEHGRKDMQTQRDKENTACPIQTGLCLKSLDLLLYCPTPQMSGW